MLRARPRSALRSGSSVRLARRSARAARSRLWRRRRRASPRSAPLENCSRRLPRSRPSCARRRGAVGALGRVGALARLVALALDGPSSSPTARGSTGLAAEPASPTTSSLRSVAAAHRRRPRDGVRAPRARARPPGARAASPRLLPSEVLAACRRAELPLDDGRRPPPSTAAARPRGARRGGPRRARAAPSARGVGARDGRADRAGLRRGRRGGGGDGGDAPLLGDSSRAATARRRRSSSPPPAGASRRTATARRRCRSARRATRGRAHLQRRRPPRRSTRSTRRKAYLMLPGKADSLPHRTAEHQERMENSSVGLGAAARRVPSAPPSSGATASRAAPSSPRTPRVRDAPRRRAAGGPPPFERKGQRGRVEYGRCARRWRGRV